MSQGKTAAGNPTLEIFELLDALVDRPADEREKILEDRDPAVVAEVRAMLEGDDP